ncbi:MAG: hypothetical protein ACREN7_00660 [Candidatus Dormibacteria bacterium]
MDDADLPLSPYRSDRQYARLETYRRFGLADSIWAGEQFGLKIHVPAAADPEAGERLARVFETMDRLPLQVKDVLRGLVDELRVEPGEAMAPATLGSWRQGVVKINRDWSRCAALAEAGWMRSLGYDLLRSTLIHEAGHALVEDRRGGVPLRDYLALVAASGWLPHPLEDPVPFGPTGRNLSTLGAYYLARLRQVDPKWQGDLPLGDPAMPAPAQLERDLMRYPSPYGQVGTVWRGSLNLLGAQRLLRTLRREDLGTLNRTLGTRGLHLDDVDVTLRRRRGISAYAEEATSETPAEIFRFIHAPYARAEHSRTSIDEGERLLLEPWRRAERAIGARRPPLAPENPWRQLQLVRRGVGRELGR